MSEIVQVEIEKIRAIIVALESLLRQLDQAINRIEMDSGDW